jgi:hypothetical protein
MMLRDGRGFLHAAILTLALTKWGQPDRKLTMAGGGSDEIIRGKR